MESHGATAELLQVSQDGLGAEARGCESVAGRLGANGAPTAVGSSVLASSAAVNAAHAQIAAAGMRCVVRVQATATKLAAASAGYGECEASSAAQFRTLGHVTVC
jgi:hypothetical protein